MTRIFALFFIGLIVIATAGQGHGDEDHGHHGDGIEQPDENCGHPGEVDIKDDVDGYVVRIGDFVFRTNGKSDKATFIVGAANTYAYRVEFAKMFQSATNEAPFDPVWRVNLEGQYSWTCTRPMEVNHTDYTEYTFTLAGTPNKDGEGDEHHKPVPSSALPSLAITGHIQYNNVTMDFKYDFAIENFDAAQWQNDTNYLVIAYRLKELDLEHILDEGKGEHNFYESQHEGKHHRQRVDMAEDEQTVSFGGLVLGATETTQEGLPVVTTTGNDEIDPQHDHNKFLFLAYAKFDGSSMVHDPSLTLRTEISAAWTVTLSFSAFFVSFVALLINQL